MQVLGMKSLGPLYILILFAVKILHGVNEVRAGSLTFGEDVYFEIVYPPELEYTYKLRPAVDFGAPFNASFLEEEIPLVPAVPATGCQLADNADDLRGHVALVERGDCSFFAKSLIAEKAGAKAVIIAGYHSAALDEPVTSSLSSDYYYVEMTHDNSVSDSVSIPAGFLLGVNGRMIRETLKRLNQPFALINIPVNLTFTSVDKLPQPPWVFW